MKKETILITGGAGFIGSHTADALAKAGYNVRLLDNLTPPVHDGSWPQYTAGFERVKGDVRRREDWLKALRGVSVVYHLAAYQDQRPDVSRFFEVNTVGTALLYELIATKQLPIRKIILASSQFVYGDGKYMCPHSRKFFYPELRHEGDLERGHFDILCPHNKPATFFSFREDQPVTPTNAYGLSKHALEQLGMRFGKTYGVPTVALRYSVVQGPRQSPRNLYSGAMRIFCTQALSGRPMTVFEDGRQLRDFVNIRDVVAANVVVLKNKKANFELFNVGGGKAYRVGDFAGLVKKISGSESSVVFGGFRRTDTRHAVSDIAKLKKFGWRPRVSVETSIRDYLSWYRAEFLL